MWVARVTGIAVARRPRAYPLAFGPGSVAVVRGRGGRCGPGATGFNLVRFRAPRTEPWNQRLTTVDNPHIILMTHGSGVFHSQSRTHCGWCTHRRSLGRSKNKTTDDPVRRLHNAAPQRTTRKPQTILRARGGALAIRAACSWRASPQPTGTEFCPQHPCS